MHLSSPSFYHPLRFVYHVNPSFYLESKIENFKKNINR
ncbi:MAG: hypothetical protein OJF59_001858 [Cytophagales bacterium]|nr:MAG: hypothetical protein OJF59_001858 [Cytophagales bacterium]